MAPDSITITFLRHGESVGNLENRFQGHADYPLTEKGRSQARALAKWWNAEGISFNRACSSPLLRARETAEIICAGSGTTLEFDPDWMEINNGLLAGLTPEEGMEVAPRPDFFTPYTRWGVNGESRWEVYLRAGRNIQKLMDHPVERTLVVAHGGILNMVLYAILGIPPQAAATGPRFMFHNTTFASFSYEPAHHNWHMLHFDDRSHLKGMPGVDGET
jgi:2,3-bisphosphoglycerate-dependent phosphoglycerate mutase